MAASASSYFVISYCIPQKKKEDEEWVELKEQFPDSKKLEKKITFYRQEFPGRKWQIDYIEIRRTQHLTISE